MSLIPLSPQTVALLSEERGDWFQTYTGKRFFPLAPVVEDICIEDIARALSMQCRFAGHVREFYSVAQHSVLVSLHVPAEHALWGLLHDAAEAYCQDVIRPVKHSPSMAPYRAIEERMEAAIAARFGLPYEMPACIKEADNRALMTERRDVLATQRAWSLRAEPFPSRIIPQPPEVAEEQFLLRFRELTAEGRGL
jgi:hypothetical protein